MATPTVYPEFRGLSHAAVVTSRIVAHGHAPVTGWSPDGNAEAGRSARTAGAGVASAAWLGISDVASSCSDWVRPPGSPSRAASRGRSPGPSRSPGHPIHPIHPGTIRQPGDRPDPRKPEGVDLLPQIEHIVIYMQENHSYDSYFGTFGRGDGFTTQHGVPTNSCVDAEGRVVPVTHAPDTCQQGRGVSQNWVVDAPPDRRRPHGRLPVRRQLQRDALLGRHRPPLLLVAREHVPALRPLVRVGARADVPEPHVPAGGHVPGPDLDRHQQGAADAAPGRRHHLGQAQRARHLVAATTRSTCPTCCCSRRRSARTSTRSSTSPQFLADCAAGTLPSVSIVSPGVARVHRGEPGRHPAR